MKRKVFFVTLFSVCAFLIGIYMLLGGGKYYAEGFVQARQPQGTPYDANFFTTQIKTIRSLASSLLPREAKLLVEHVTPNTELMRIVVIHSDPRKSVENCNLVITAYMEQNTTNVELTRPKGIEVTKRPFGNRHAKTSKRDWLKPLKEITARLF